MIEEVDEGPVVVTWVLQLLIGGKLVEQGWNERMRDFSPLIMATGFETESEAWERCNELGLVDGRDVAIVRQVF